MPAVERPAVRLDVFGRRRRTPRYPVLGFRRQAEMFKLLISNFIGKRTFCLITCDQRSTLLTVSIQKHFFLQL